MAFEILRMAHPERPAQDIAISGDLLSEVARGERGPVARLYRPGATLAFGKLDSLQPGYARARGCATAHGYEPVLRIAGGRAAAYDGGSLVYEEIVPVEHIASGLRERFEAMAGMLVTALRAVGADARIGALDGEYCPGEFSINVGGAIKVAGLAQRVKRGAALITSSIVVTGGEPIRTVLVDVYRELGLAWVPATAGALEDVVPGVTVEKVATAILDGVANNRN